MDYPRNLCADIILSVTNLDLSTIVTNSLATAVSHGYATLHCLAEAKCNHQQTENTFDLRV